MELAAQKENNERILAEKEEIKEFARESREEIEKAFLETEKGRRDLEKMNQMMVGREMRMIDLKKEVARLKKKCGDV